jgi:hypothetical protein
MVKLHLLNEGKSVAELSDDTCIINSAHDAVEFISNAGSSDCDRFIIYEENLNPGFFDLKTGLAGDILQKFSNYRVRLAVIGDFSKFKSKSLQDFFRESNRTGHILFVKDLQEGLRLLGK